MKCVMWKYLAVVLLLCQI